MSIKINRLEIENVKRVKAVALEPSESGLTVIGGRNGQGKTSVLDAIAWALGGNRFRPSQPERDGSVVPPEIRIRLSNGLIVERKGKSSALTVTDPSGARAGQSLLDGFVEQLALDLPRFIAAGDKEKAETLLKIIGVGDQVTALDLEEKEAYNQRLTIGRIADQKAKYAKEMPVYPDVPITPISASDLIRRQQDILARNGENARKRARLREIASRAELIAQRVNAAQEALARLKAEQEETAREMEIAEMDAVDLADESTAELEQDIEHIEDINRQVRANCDREKAEEDARAYADQYDALTQSIDSIRSRRRELLERANLPLPGLTVEDGYLKYKGKSWDCMSGAEQLRCATAIVRRLNPDCGFVLLDKLEQMDEDTLMEFGAWLEGEGLQAIATRVSSRGEDCTIMIEDGRIAGEAVPVPEAKTWKAGEF